METYLNVPSGFPLTKAQAWKIAKSRWNLQAETNRLDNAGITWQAVRGEVIYATWDELPAATRHYA